MSENLTSYLVIVILPTVDAICITIEAASPKHACAIGGAILGEAIISMALGIEIATNPHDENVIGLLIDLARDRALSD